MAKTRIVFTVKTVKRIVLFKMRYETRPVLSKEEYAYKRKTLFKNEPYHTVLYWVANYVMRGKC